MDEQTLLKALHDKGTKERAFSCLVSQYSEKLYWTVRHIVGTHEDADDIVQNAFVKAWTKIDNFRGDSKINTWLHRIAVNEALDHLRREKKHLDSLSVTDMGDRTLELSSKTFADPYFDGNEAEKLLRQVMETLPEAQRTVFSLKYFEHMQYKEISEILGTSEGGLKANYHHAVEKIKLNLSKFVTSL